VRCQIKLNKREKEEKLKGFGRVEIGKAMDQLFVHISSLRHAHALLKCLHTMLAQSR